MRRPLRDLLHDLISPAPGGRRAKLVVLAGVLGMAAATGVALRDDEAAVGAVMPASVVTPAEVLTEVVAATPFVHVESVETVDAAQAGLDPSRLDEAVAAVRRELARGAFPGAVLGVGRGANLVRLEGIGKTAWNEGEVDPRNTVYDLASLTKVVATTTAVMLLVEDGKMELDAPVQRYLPEFSGGAKSLVTIRHLLAHTSGLPAWTDVEGLSWEAGARKILQMPLKAQPGKRVEYSDLGFVVLFSAAERAAGEPIPQLLQRRVFGPLGMNNTRFLAGEGCEVCAPTMVMDGEVIRGIVHDPIARTLGGVAGNAGLFSTAPDLARFAAMLASGGELNGVRVLREETIREFTRRQPRAGTRALGWDTPESDGTGAAGRRISSEAFGHTGFTGTSLWVDPERGTWTVLLTNRTFEPRASSRMQSLRRQVHDEVALSAARAAAAE